MRGLRINMLISEKEEEACTDTKVKNGVLKEKTEEGKEHRPEILTVMIYIQDHCGEELNWETLSYEAMLSPGYLRTLFRKETGKSLHQYISQCRMEKAEELLAETNLTVGEIMSMLSVKHLSYFGKQFRNYSGLSPVEYRKRVMDPQTYAAWDE